MCLTCMNYVRLAQEVKSEPSEQSGVAAVTSSIVQTVYHIGCGKQSCVSGKQRAQLVIYDRE